MFCQLLVILLIVSASYAANGIAGFDLSQLDKLFGGTLKLPSTKPKPLPNCFKNFPLTTPAKDVVNQLYLEVATEKEQCETVTLKTARGNALCLFCTELQKTQAECELEAEKVLCKRLIPMANDINCKKCQLVAVGLYAKDLSKCACAKLAIKDATNTGRIKTEAERCLRNHKTLSELKNKFGASVNLGFLGCPRK